MEVELPCRDILRIVPILVCQRDADLDYLEQVDITSHRLVVVVRRGLELAYWSRNDTGEFGILAGYELLPPSRKRARDRDHCNVGVLVDQFADVAHFGLELRGPYFSYSRHAFATVL